MRGIFFVLVFSLLVATNCYGEKPNVLLVYVDDLGYGDLGSYDHPVVETPVIDQLAEEGVRFTQFYAPSALCSPSRAGLLTGRFPYRTGIRTWIPDDSSVSMNPDEVTIAAAAKSKGYRTAVIGKWHLNGGLHMAEALQPEDFGFDFQYGLSAWVKNNDAQENGKGNLYPDNMYRNNQPVGKTNKLSAELVSDEAISWLDQNREPFFLLLTYSEVHAPIASPPDFVMKYEKFLTEEAIQRPLEYHMNWSARPYRGRGEYYANISFLDFQLGRVIAYLRKTGELENTLVIFSSDNGPVTSEALHRWEVNMAGETNGLRGKKRFLFEGGIRVPGIIRWPKYVEIGKIEREVVTALDIFPTIAEVIEYDASHLQLDGDSIFGLLRGHEMPTERNEKLFYWSIPTPDGMEYAARWKNWKIILNSRGDPVYLFDLASDKNEVTNLISSEQKIVDTLVTKVTAIKSSIDQSLSSDN